MGRNPLLYEKMRLHVWVLPNQVRDLELLKRKLGKTKTDIVIEALGIYFNEMRKQGVLEWIG